MPYPAAPIPTHAMFPRKTLLTALSCALALLTTSCSHHDSVTQKTTAGARDADDTVVNFYNWADNIAPGTISSFEKETGIKVNVTFFETEKTLESRLLTGHSGFGVVVTRLGQFP